MALVGTLVVVFLVFPTTVETLSRGKSLGKWAFGLRAVRDDAGPISFQHAFVRALVGLVEIYLFFGAPAFFSALLSSRGKRLGDYAAGTYVVRERIRLRLAPPGPDAARARGLGAGGRRAPRCRPGWRSPCASSCGGCPGSTRPRRVSVGATLAAAGRRRTSPRHRRAGTPPEAFLAAVIATRRERDQARLDRERAFRERLTARGG